MNVRQQLYKKHRFEGMSKYAAARKAGYSHAYATQAINIEKRINMPALIEMAGLTDSYLVNYIKEAMKAMKLQACDIYIKECDDGSYQINKNSNDFVEIADWHARHKFLNTLLELAEKKKVPSLVDLSTHTHFQFEYGTVKEDKVRASQSPDGSLGKPSALEGLGGRAKVRENLAGGSYANEEGAGPTKG